MIPYFLKHILHVCNDIYPFGSVYIYVYFNCSIEVEDFHVQFVHLILHLYGI